MFNLSAVSKPIHCKFVILFGGRLYHCSFLGSSMSSATYRYIGSILKVKLFSLEEIELSIEPETDVILSDLNIDFDSDKNRDKSMKTLLMFRKRYATILHVQLVVFWVFEEIRVCCDQPRTKHMVLT